ncbi:hypothetical protein [Polyangium spumosum]|uniref:DUF4286 family protein n=1 Tax=Polyangium spumosum TaxID=889282 RepID=A0A6N7Q1F1_9BACT|nr:hypothetical protein [Polyangium spumosum]MRG98113.1 hypothetical protein [Polyangium spumosum]
MYVARWQFTARFGRKDECLKVLRKWYVDVAQRIGWRSLRVLAGSIGGPESQVELEVPLDNVEDLEAAWRDMAAVPYHAEYQKQLGELIVHGTERWTIHRVADLTPSES